MTSFCKNSLSIFFLASFLLLRVVNVHAVSHVFLDSDAHQCEQCALIAQTNQGTPLDLGTVQTDFSFLNPLDWAQENGFALYDAPYLIPLHSDYFHNKPPPSNPLG